MLTRDPLLISLLPVMLRLPWFLFAIPAGIVTDRVDRRRLIWSMDAFRAAAFLFAAGAIWQSLPLTDPPAEGTSNPALFMALMLAALLVGLAEVIRDNAAQTILPSLVEHDQLERANGRLWSVELLGNALLGPAVGAFLIAYALPSPYLFNAFAYVVSTLLVASLVGKFMPASAKRRNWREELKEAIAFLQDAPLMRSLAWITGYWNLIFSIVLIALVLHVQENLGLGARAYGLILASGALGGILGALAGERLIRHLGAGRTAQLMLLASAPAYVAIYLAPGAITLALSLAVFEFTGLVWNTVSVSYRQRTIPDALLGRVNSLYRLLAWGMIPIGLVLSGFIVRLADGPLSRNTALEMPFLVAAIGALILGLAGWKPLGRGFAHLH